MTSSDSVSAVRCPLSVPSAQAKLDLSESKPDFVAVSFYKARRVGGYMAVFPPSRIGSSAPLSPSTLQRAFPRARAQRRPLRTERCAIGAASSYRFLFRRPRRLLVGELTSCPTHPTSNLSGTPRPYPFPLPTLSRRSSGTRRALGRF